MDQHASKLKHLLLGLWNVEHRYSGTSIYNFRGNLVRKAAVILTLALILVAGCSSPQTAPEQKESASSSPAPASSTTTETISRASEEETCTKLMGSNSDGPLYGTINLIAETGATSDGASLVATARLLSSEMHDIAEDAPPSMAVDLKNFYSPLDDIIGLDDKTRVRSNFNADTWKEAGLNLLDLCAPYDVGTDSSASAPKVAAPSSTKADQISARFPGYPLIVNVGSLDYRVANWFDGQLVDGQVVALAPGLYSPFNPNVPDLKSYYESGGVAGDSAIKEAVLPNAGGATWSGVLPGAEEPR